MFVTHTSSPAHFDPSVYEAARKGNLPEIQKFILKGGWVDMPDGKGNSMLYYAGKHGHGKVVSYLQSNGAHIYTNLKGRTASDKAAVEVKFTIAKMKSGLLTRLVEAHVKQFKTHEEAIQFLLSIQPKNCRTEVLRDYAEHIAFESPQQALLIVDHLVGSVRAQVVRNLVHTSLSCGDIASAYAFVQKLPTSDQAHKELLLQIEIFTGYFKEVETKVQKNSSQFPEEIRDGLETLNILHELPKEDVERLITKMSKTQSFAGALKCANELENPKLRGFARCGLSHCGLENLARSAKKAAEKKLEEGFEELGQRVQESLEKASQTKDFTEVLKFIQSIKDLSFQNTAYMAVSLTMCQAGQYKEAYNLVHIQFEKKNITEHYVESLEDILSIVKEKGEKEWTSKFSKLQSW